MNTEFNLLFIAKKIKKLLFEYKGIFIGSFIVFMSLAIMRFVFINLQPDYKIQFQLKSNIVDIQDVRPIVEQVNSYILYPDYNSLNSKLSNYINNFKIYNVNVEEIKSDEAFLNKKEKSSKYFQISILTKSKINKDSIQYFKNDFVKFLKSKLNNSEIQLNKKLIDQNISEIEKILTESYNINGLSTSNPIIYENYFKGLNDIQNEKYMKNFSSKYHEEENLIISDSPALCSFKNEFPVLILFIGFFAWVVFVSIFMVWVVLFKENN